MAGAAGYRFVGVEHLARESALFGGCAWYSRDRNSGHPNADELGPIHVLVKNAAVVQSITLDESDGSASTLSFRSILGDGAFRHSRVTHPTLNSQWVEHNTIPGPVRARSGQSSMGAAESGVLHCVERSTSRQDS